MRGKQKSYVFGAFHAKLVINSSNSTVKVVKKTHFSCIFYSYL